MSLSKCQMGKCEDAKCQMSNVKISNVKCQTWNTLRQMSEYENVICQTPRGYWFAWDVTYVVRSNVKGEILYVKCENMKMSLRSAIACRSQNVKCENVKTSTRPWRMSFIVWVVVKTDWNIIVCTKSTQHRTAMYWLAREAAYVDACGMWTLASVLRADCMYL